MQKPYESKQFRDEIETWACYLTNRRSNEKRSDMRGSTESATNTSGEMRSSPGWELALLPVSQSGLAIQD